MKTGLGNKPPLWSWKKRAQESSEKLNENPYTFFNRALFKWLVRRLGIICAILLVLLVSGLWWLWSNWNSLKTRPGVPSALSQMQELRPLPIATGNRFSIAIVDLENDPEGSHQRLLREALSREDGIELLVLPRTIALGSTPKPQEEVSAGHERARKLLIECHADVMIWGSVLDEKTNGPMSLHWTTAQNVSLNKTVDTYRPSEENYDLPELFWNQLTSVITLLAITQQSDFDRQEGSYIGSKILTFADRVRALLESDKLKDNQKATMYMILGKALSSYGGETGDRAAFIDAVAALRLALDKQSRREAPDEWAAAQNGLGNALAILGSSAGSVANLTEAVQAYQYALEERTRTRLPIGWAATQNNLGNALTALADFEANESALNRLQDAIQAYRSALEEFTSANAPLAWAETQNNLGIALTALGQRTGGITLLEQAAQAFQMVLQTYPHQRAPLVWAATQYNLGAAQTQLGKLTHRADQFSAAVEAYQSALNEYTRERTPMNWADAQTNLGIALQNWGGTETPGTLQLKAASSALRAALGVYTQEQTPTRWIGAMYDLGATLKILGEGQSDASETEEATASFNSVLRTCHSAEGRLNPASIHVCLLAQRQLDQMRTH